MINTVIPGIVSALVVKPNQITLEDPYSKQDIKFFELDEEQQIHVGKDIHNAAVTGNDQYVLDNMRRWDPRAFKDTLKEQRGIRLHYEFYDIDMNQYHLIGDYRQVMLTLRELRGGTLDLKSQTWVSQHLEYARGHGLVLLPDGGPFLWRYEVPRGHLSDGMDDACSMPQFDVKNSIEDRPWR